MLGPSVSLCLAHLGSCLVCISINLFRFFPLVIFLIFNKFNIFILFTNMQCMTKDKLLAVFALPTQHTKKALKHDQLTRKRHSLIAIQYYKLHKQILHIYVLSFFNSFYICTTHIIHIHKTKIKYSTK